MTVDKNNIYSVKTLFFAIFLTSTKYNKIVNTVLMLGNGLKYHSWFLNQAILIVISTALVKFVFYHNGFYNN